MFLSVVSRVVVQWSHTLLLYSIMCTQGASFVAIKYNDCLLIRCAWQIKSVLTRLSHWTLKHHCAYRCPAFTLQISVMRTSLWLWTKCVIRDRNTTNNESPSCSLRSAISLHLFESQQSNYHVQQIRSCLQCEVFYMRGLLGLCMISIHGSVD